jgi:hypothetical protein
MPLNILDLAYIIRFLLLELGLFVHSISVGFIFNAILGVDVVLMDLFIGVFGFRLKVRPSYLPVVLLNTGLIMRAIYDISLQSPILLLSSPLQGLEIVSFFLNFFHQIFSQLRGGRYELKDKGTK